MRRRFSKVEEPKGGFTLIEVIIATGILATSILAIIAFLGATAQATSNVINNTVASRIADNVRAELENVDLDQLYVWADPANNPPLQLFATKDGERVRVGGPSGNVGNDEITGTPPGIADGNRYFLIEIRRLEESLEFVNAADLAKSTILPISVQVVWPHHVRINTNPEDFEAVAPEGQSRYIFNTIISRKP